MKDEQKGDVQHVRRIADRFEREARQQCNAVRIAELVNDVRALRSLADMAEEFDGRFTTIEGEPCETQAEIDRITQLYAGPGRWVIYTSVPGQDGWYERFMQPERPAWNFFDGVKIRTDTPSLAAEVHAAMSKPWLPDVAEFRKAAGLERRPCGCSVYEACERCNPSWCPHCGESTADYSFWSRHAYYRCETHRKRFKLVDSNPFPETKAAQS